MMKAFQKKKQEGFTLVETLVGVFVITTVLTAAFTAAHTSLKSAQRARDQVTAFYLAQEGYELIKNVRDSNVQERGDKDHWMTGWGPVSCGDGCRISPLDGAAGKKPTIFTNADTKETKLKINDNNKRYQYTNGSDSRFVRWFTVSNTNINDELQVDMTIQWDDSSGKTQTFETTEYIANWRF